MKKSMLILLVYFMIWNTQDVTCKQNSTIFRHQHEVVLPKNFNKRRYCAPISLYSNHSATFRLVISGDIETNPGPAIRLACSGCQKTVRKNSYHLECKVCQNLSHIKCINPHANVKNYLQKKTVWTCSNCLIAELPFYHTNLLDCLYPEENVNAVEIPGQDHQNHKQNLDENRKHFSISHLNIQSMKDSSAELEAMLLNHKFDILTLSETWLVENPALIKQMSFSGYQNFEYRNRANRGGGVGTYFKEGLEHRPRPDIEQKDPTIEHQWFEVKGKNSFMLAVFYQPSSVDSDKRLWMQKFETLIAYVFTIWSGPIVITGDTNIDLLKDDYNIAREFKETLERLGLNQHITKPTRKGKSLIDHVITNLPNIIHEGVIPCDEMSDHDAPYIICKIRKPRFESRYKYIRIEKNFQPNLFKSDVEQLPFNLVYAFDQPEQQLDIFNELFLSCLNRHAPLVRQKITRPPAPWLKDLNITEKQQERNFLRKQAHTSQSSQDWESFRRVRNELKKLIRTAKSNFYRRALSSKRPKEVWSTIHRILQPSPQKINADPDTLNTHFNTTAQRLLNSRPKSESHLQNVINNFEEHDDAFNINEVTYSDVRKAILGLRNDCSTGDDQLPSKYLKLCVEDICSPLCYIINSSIKNKIFPNQWKISKITPIPKVNHPAESSDYRPISILPILSKVFEKLIMKQIVTFLENEELLAKNQSGFRKGHCTISTCIKIKNDILKAMKRGEVTLAVLADFSKAFDTVDFEILMKKLHSLRFSKGTLSILSSYLSNRQQFVQINDKKSGRLIVTNGVPQGSILGPVLFNIYVYDLSNQTEAECVQYADDTSMYRHTKPKLFEQCLNQINSDVAAIQNWSKESNLIFNDTKTKSMLFATRQMSKTHQFDLQISSNNGKVIERVPTFKLLGVTFSEDLTWNNHVKKAISSSCGTLKSISLLKRFLPYHLRKQLAEMLILSKLDYGIALLDNAPLYLFNQMQRVQNATASFVRRRYSRCIDVIDLKWLPMIERSEHALVKLAWKSVNRPDWPKFLNVKKDDHARPRFTRSCIDGGTKLVRSNVSGSFEYEATNLFNSLPKKCRNSINYKEFCNLSKKHLLDKALARSLA